MDLKHNKILSTFMKKTVFMTGATGNFGSAGLAELLKKTDRFKIRILVRPSTKNKKLLKRCAGNPSVEVIWGDLMNYYDVYKGVTGADYVLHVGALVSPQADFYPERAYKINVTGTENIVKAILAQDNPDNIKLVYIGSVAQCGDRLYPIHWGRTGDPVYASKFDMYSVSKCVSERIVANSGLKYWVSLRQSGILYPGIFRQFNPVAFHVPMRGMLEWATIEDSARVLSNVVEDWVPEEFWNRFYNISSGEQYRMSNYEMESRLLKPLGINNIERIFEPRWFALMNFHGMWYTDSDLLENYLHFRENLPVEDYFTRLASRLPWYYPLARFVPSFLIKAFLRPLTYHKELGTQAWQRHYPEKIEAYYGSTDVFRNLTSWKSLRPLELEKNLDKAVSKGEVRTLDHGYDETKSIYTLTAEEVEAAAEFRGGHFIGPAEMLGEKGALFEWECEHGHRFSSSLEYVLLGGGWCPVCPIDTLDEISTDKNKFISEVLSPQSLL